MTENEPMNEPMQATLVTEIQGGNDEIDVDSFEDFEHVFPPEALASIHSQVQQIIELEGMQEDDVLVAGFTYDPENPNAADEFKLRERHNYEGNIADTNTSQLIHREIAAERLRINAMARELQELDDADILTSTVRAEKSAVIGRQRAKIADLQEQLKQPPIPLYFFTKVDGLLHRDPEHNPLAYSGIDGFTPGASGIALFDAQAMRAAGYEITEKGDTQLMTAITGDQLRGFVKAQLFLNVK